MRGALYSHFLDWQEAELAARAAERTVFQKACRVDAGVDDLATPVELAQAHRLRREASRLLAAYLEEVRLRSAALRGPGR